MDLYADPAERGEPNAFVELLWERGSLYEKEVIAGLKDPFLDLSRFAGDEKDLRTSEAITREIRSICKTTHKATSSATIAADFISDRTLFIGHVA